MIPPLNSLCADAVVEVPKPERVYFLGAGASKAIYPDLPLAKDLTLGRLLEYDDANYMEYAAASLQKVRQLLGGSLASMDSAPIEEVLSQAELSGQDRSSIVQCILYRLSLVDTGASRLLQTWLTKLRSKGHAIVTTNYDTVCERNLPRLDRIVIGRNTREWLDYGIPYDLCAKRGSPSLWRKCESDKCLLLLKLHGSVGWSRCLKCGGYMLHPVALFKGARAADTPYLKEAACPDCNGDPWPVLIPPVENKQYHDQALQHVWHRAEQILRTAREIVFAGYSLPPTDDMVRTMLGDCRDPTNPQKVFVVDQNATGVAGEFRKIYGNSVSEASRDWRTYLQEMLNQA